MKNNIIKFLVIFLVVGIVAVGITYLGYCLIDSLEMAKEMNKMVKQRNNNTVTEAANKDVADSENVFDNLWVGTFNLVWNDFMDKEIGGPIKFADGESKLADELNKQSFKESEVNPKSLYKVMCEAKTKNKIKIEKDLKDKFNEKSEFLDRVNWDMPNNYIVYAMLKKEFNFNIKFPILNSKSFKDSTEKYKFFGIEPDTNSKATDTFDILFYNDEDDFAVRLNTKELEEVYLYRTSNQDKSYEELFNEMIDKKDSYNGSKDFNSYDTLAIPFIKVKDEISYDELCNRPIIGSDAVIQKALQNIDFELNNCGGLVKSEALIEYLKNSIMIDEENKDAKKMIFDDDFILFMKEADKEKPYLALRVDNPSVLIKDEVK